MGTDATHHSGLGRGTRPAGPDSVQERMMRLEGATQAYKEMHIRGVKGATACIICVKLMYRRVHTATTPCNAFRVPRWRGRFCSKRSTRTTRLPSHQDGSAASRDVGDWARRELRRRRRRRRRRHGKVKNDKAWVGVVAVQEREEGRTDGVQPQLTYQGRWQGVLLLVRSPEGCGLLVGPMK